MVQATLNNGVIVPSEPLPSAWQEGAALEIALAQPPALDIDAWAKTMNALCQDIPDEEEGAMRQAIEEHRREAKAQVRRIMGLSA